MKEKQLFQLLSWKSLDSEPIKKTDLYYLVGGKTSSGKWKTKYIYIDNRLLDNKAWRVNDKFYITHYANPENVLCDVFYEILPSNGKFSIKKGPYKPNDIKGKKGTGLVVDVIDHKTGKLNTIKVYSNSLGLHFNKAKINTALKTNNEYTTNYLKHFTKKYIYIPYQIKEKSKFF
jgi:hypothetical protein